MVVNPRGPVSSLQPRNSLKHAAHGGKGPALPDLEGGTHIPEKELIPRHHESQHTALRPSNPYDVTVSMALSKRDPQADDGLLYRPWTALPTREAPSLETTWPSNSLGFRLALTTYL